jgi:hypothetical protein
MAAKERPLDLADLDGSRSAIPGGRHFPQPVIQERLLP